MSIAGSPAEHLDVLIVGAGISGIGAARYVTTELPDTSYAVLEGRAASGGTWDLFRYPGIRSDSDLYTFSYEFKPWTEDQAIAGGDQILGYLRETATEYGIDKNIRYNHRVVSASWSSEEGMWTVEVDRVDLGTRTVFTARWIFGATGYYDYDEGFTPQFAGRDDFTGQVIHPQHWPEDLNYSGKNIVVIGSGATAVTLVPALAEGGAGHITMLQRTPTYVLPVPREDKIAVGMRKVFGEKRGYRMARHHYIRQQRWIYSLCQRFPKASRRFIRFVNTRALGKNFDVDTHFNPPYDPWDQRLCAVPDGDMFRTIRQGKASVITDRIARFDATGIVLESGDRVDADIIVTATGLNLKMLGGMSLTVDGVAFNAPDHVAYKGMMLSGVPNFAFAIGYTNSSWTLKVGLLCKQFVELLGYMKTHAYGICVAVAPEMDTRPLLDFGAGYVQRSVHSLPRQGDSAPWAMSMSYLDDVKLVESTPVVDENLQFSRASSPAVSS